jgi:hypothetical protein
MVGNVSEIEINNKKNFTTKKIKETNYFSYADEGLF